MAQHLGLEGGVTEGDATFRGGAVGIYYPAMSCNEYVFFRKRKGDMEFKTIGLSLNSYKGHLKHGHTYHLRRKIWTNYVLTRGSSPASDA